MAFSLDDIPDSFDVSIWPNIWKKEDRHPDIRIHLRIDDEWVEIGYGYERKSQGGKKFWGCKFNPRKMMEHVTAMVGDDEENEKEDDDVSIPF